MTVNFKKTSFWIMSLCLSILVLLIVSLLLLAFRTNPLTFLDVVFLQPWKSLSNFSGFFNVFSILLLVSLAIAITFKYKIYNFGVPGQMMLSSIVTYVIAVGITRAGGTHRAIVIFLLLMTIVVGAAAGLIIALLKNYFRINEIVSTILINFIVWEGYKGLLANPIYQENKIPEILSLRFSLVSGPFSASNLFSAGIIIAVLVLVITILLFNNRTVGFKLNAVAKNPVAAKQARIDPSRQILKVLPISGAIAGLGGYLYFLSTSNALPKINNIPQEGFYAIAIAALAFYEPSLIALSSVMFTFFIRPIHYNSFAYLKNPGIVVTTLGITVYLMGLFPFSWYLWDQSPYIQEKWFWIRRKLFKIATPFEEDVLGLEKKSSPRKVESLNLNLEKKRKRIKDRLKLKRLKWIKKKKKKK